MLVLARLMMCGNMPNILSRMTAHTRALFSVLSIGTDKGHHGNPAASIRVEKLYDSPVLLNGLSSLVLSKAEQTALDHHYKVNLERLQRLYKATPAPVVYFLAGSLPATAFLHMRQFFLLGMIARLGPSHILNKHGSLVLADPAANKFSWFCQVL